MTFAPPSKQGAGDKDAGVRSSGKADNQAQGKVLERITTEEEDRQ